MRSHLPDQGSNPTSSIGRQILNHWTREVPKTIFFFNFKNFTWGSREGREQARGHKEGETRLIPKMRGKVRGR